MRYIVAIVILLASRVSGFVPCRQPSQRTSPRSALAASNANELTPLKKGSTVALVTPMTSTGEIDYANLRTLLQHHVEAGTKNLCLLGTTGEASVMDMDERKQVIETAVDEVKGKMSILVGTGTINPAHVKEMTLQAIDLGCDANLIVTPYYVKPPQRGLIQHFTSMADLGLPVVMYNVPGRTSSDLSDESIGICAQHSGIVGLKDATGKLERYASIRSQVGDDFLLYSGDDGTSLDYVLQGGDGCISVTANVAAARMSEVMENALAGNEKKAKELNAPLLGLHKKLFCEANPIPIKWAAKRVGLIKTAYCRPPLAEMDSQFEPIVEEALKAAGLI